MTFISTRRHLLRTAAAFCTVFLLCLNMAGAQTTGLYIEFPDDETAPNCDYNDFGGDQPVVLPLSNELVAMSYTDQVFLSLPDTCFKTLRTWSVIDWNTYNPALPLVSVPNPIGPTGPTVSAPGAASPWQPSQIGGLNYADFWSATANGYQYTQIISHVSAGAQPGLYIRFPRDVFANNCNPQDTLTDWGKPTVKSLGISQFNMTYTDQVFLGLPADTCFKIERTWTVLDWTAPTGPAISVPNPQGLNGPTVSAFGTLPPWQPSQISGVNYASFWNPSASTYTYKQIIFAKSTATSGLYIRFPADVVVNSCNPSDTVGWPKPVVLPLSNELVSTSYTDEIFTASADACLKIERTWRIIDWNTHNPALPFVTVPNPADWQPGPTVSGPGAHSPWFPSSIAGTNYVNFWSANANGYEYKQIITYTPLECPKDTVLVAAPSACTATLDYALSLEPGWSAFQIAGLPSGSAFPTGTTVNEFQAAGTIIKCSFKVTVKELALPVARCKFATTVNIGADDPADCYEGGVSWVNASAFNDGSSDNCGSIHLTVRRAAPYSDCILGLNITNGHEPCDDTAPDFPSEFERALTEQDSIKFYCCQAGTAQQLYLRAYQLNADGTFALDLNGKTVFSDCITTVLVSPSACGDTVPSLSGFIKMDADGDCAPDPNQTGVPGMVVKMLDSNGDTLYASSTLLGYYRFVEPAAGTTVLEVMPPLPIWEICDNPDTLNLLAGAQSYHDFSAQPTANCPMLTIDLATDLLRPCRISNWYASYCNLGGSTATNAYVQIVAAQPLVLLSASKPFSISGDTMTVQIGDVAVGGCGGFSILVEAPCDPGIIGDQLCIEAHIFPDTMCIPPSAQWSGAQMEASAICEGDSVRFTLLNTGSAPTVQALDYVIIDDMVVMLQGQVPAGFGPGATLLKTVPSTGELLRMRSEQEPNHPSAQPPSVAVQNCNGASQPSLLLEFENEDGSTFTDLECLEVVASFDPNEKLAFPRGFSAQHLIEEDTRLTYQINFQNTGTDTAFLVVLRDTLSPLLDPASIRVGAGSHPYTWSLSGKGIVEFRFENILLPDSTTNEAASHGFVQFYIDQKPGNAIGSHIENRAGIYFDIVNPVVLTNTVWHTVGKDFVATSSVKNPTAASLLHIFPNPATESAFVALEQEKQVQIRLIDVFGRTVRTFSGKAPGVQLLRNGLAAGVYFVEMSDGKGWQQVGKLMWK